MLDWDDQDIKASRAIEPYYYRAPVPDQLPEGIKPLDFQFAGVEYRLSREHALIGDQPGLTKTAQSIIAGNGMGAKKTLCIVPASLRLNWEREIWTWSTTPNVSTYPVLKASDGISDVSDYVIISYDLLRNDDILEALLDLRWDHLILDEAHYIKDMSSVRANRICGEGGIKDVVGNITALSGTIMPNQPLEAYNIMRLLNWESISCASEETFKETYYEYGGGMIRGPVLVDEDEEGNKLANPYYANKLHWSNKVLNVPRNLEDLQWRLRKHVMVRRLKEQVLHELPKKVWKPFPLVPTADMKRALKHPGFAEAQALYEMDPEAFNRSIPVDGAISTAMRKLGEAKAPAVADYIEELLHSGIHKIVVGAWHRHGKDGKLSVLEYLRSRLGKYGLVYMDGGTNPRKKQMAVDSFQTNDAIRIMLGQMATLGEGWTLTKAQDSVLAEFFWVPGKNDQFFDRISRMGQVGEYTTCHVPVVPGTLDERVIGQVIWKDQNIHASLDMVY